MHRCTEKNHDVWPRVLPNPKNVTKLKNVLHPGVNDKHKQKVFEKHVGFSHATTNEELD